MPITANTIVWIPSDNDSSDSPKGRLTTLGRGSIIRDLRDHLVSLDKIEKHAAKIMINPEDVVSHVPEEDEEKILRDVFKNQGVTIVRNPVRLVWETSDTETGYKCTVRVEVLNDGFDPDKVGAWSVPSSGPLAGTFKDIYSEPTNDEPVYSSPDGRKFWQVSEEVFKLVEEELINKVGLDRRYVWSSERPSF